MKANLYLSRLSFLNNEDSTIESICLQITELFTTYNEVINHAKRFPESGDVIYKCNDIYELDFLEKVLECKIADLYLESCIKIPRDVKKALLKLIDRSKPTSENEEEIIHKIMNNNQEKLNGFLCINKNAFTGINSISLICDKNEWYLFHRDHLATHWKSEEYFYEELVKYFDNIYFHPNVNKTLKGLEDGGLKHFSKAIIFNLTQLNDEFKLYPITSSLRETLNKFSSECNVKVTLEGKASRKPDFTFVFYDFEGNPKEICCEPHMKLMRSDNMGDSGCHFNRIHFYPGDKNIECGKILVGHIGKHL